MKAKAFFLIEILHLHLMLALDGFTKYSKMNKAPFKEQRAKQGIFIMEKGSRYEGAKGIGSPRSRACLQMQW